MKLSVKDYQIVKKADLEFIKGLNVIIGPSNNGKSSLIKAAKAAIFNEAGTSSVRAGTTSYMVGLQNNGHTVIFQKGLKESAYSIDGERYSKLGRGQVPQVAEALGIKELVINGNKECINFWDQMAYPFLLDRSSVDLYRFIVDSGEDDNLMKCLKDMVSDRQALNKECIAIEAQIDQLANQVADLDKQLEGSDEVLDIIQKIIEMRDKVTRFQTLKTLQNRLMLGKAQLTDVISKVSKTSAQSKFLNELSSYLINQSLKSQSMLSHKSKIQEITRNKLNIEAKLKTLNILDLSKESLEKLSTYININNKLSSLKSSMDNLELKKIPSVSYSYQDIQKINLLRGIKEKLENTRICILDADEKIEKCKENINIIKDIQSHIKTCPLCGHSLN